MGPSEYLRVTPRSPCPVCGKPDWCTLGRDVVFCMRVPSSRTARNGAYIHPLDGLMAAQLPPRRDEPPRVTPAELLARYDRIRALALPLDPAARLLGLPPAILSEYGAVAHTDDGGLLVPMYDAHWNLVGVRVREGRGRKRAWPGSRNGLFLPAPARLARDAAVWALCEGPTDAMAAAAAGVAAVGRPDAFGGLAALLQLVRLLRPTRVVVIADRDEAGRRGATRVFRSVLPLPALGAGLLTPPAPYKDLRDWCAADSAGFVEAFRRAARLGERRLPDGVRP